MSQKKLSLGRRVPDVAEFKDPSTGRLSANFTEQELGVAGADARVKANARYLCRELLEAIRAHYQAPVFVTSGYREPGHNSYVGGKPGSFHLYEADHCAADFKVLGVSALDTFDWLRLESGLPFDKVILEYHDGEPRIIHIQAFAKAEPRRLAYIGETGDGRQYTPVEVA